MNPQPPQIPDPVPEGREGIPPTTAPDRSAFVSPFNDGRLIEYYYQLFNWHGYIRFLGLPHLRENQDVPLWELFVPPSFATVHISPDLPLKRWPPTREVVDTLDAAQRLVLLGDPGSGKSTLVSWIAWQFTRVAEGHLTTAFGRLIPFPLILRDLRTDRNLTWERLLEEFLRRPLAKPFEGNLAFLIPYLESGQALILLDGLDEVGDIEVRRKLREAVWEGFRRFPRCRWLLTSRIVGYEAMPFDRDESQLPHYLRLAEGETQPKRVLIHPKAARALFAAIRYLMPFSDTQVGQFVRNWYSLREAATEEAQAEAHKLVQAIRANSGTERLARIPNLLTLITLIYRIRRELPHGRVMLYDRIAEAYLESIDTYRGLKEHDYPLAQKKKWLQYVGFQMQRQRAGEALRGIPEEEQRAILIDQKTVEGWLHEAMKASRRDATPQEAATYLNFVGRRSGLLLPRGEGQYAFMHLSFQEHFAAGYLAEQILAPRWLDSKAGAGGARQDDVRAYANQVRWRETLVLLFEILAERTGWSDELADCLFGEKFQRLPEEGREDPLPPIVALLAALSADPYSGLSMAKRQAAWRVCWQLELQRQNLILGAREPEIPQLLLSASEDLRDAARSVLVNQALELEIQNLDLRGCAGMTNLAPLQELSSLKSLVLAGCTGVSDLAPLQGLSSLHSLDLSGCAGVSDLSSLQGLTALQVLDLRRCVGVTDLSPLQGLTALQVLHLADCRGVTDLSPVSHVRHVTGRTTKGFRRPTD